MIDEPPEPRYQAVYDGECDFCRWSMEAVGRWDREGKIRFVSIQSKEGQKLLETIPETARLDSWHLVLPDRSVVSAGDAVGPLLEQLPAGRPLAMLARAWPEATRHAYVFIANRRSFFGRALRRLGLIPARPPSE